MCRYLNLRPKKPENTQLFDESFFIFHKQKKYTIVVVLINLYINSLTHKQYQNTIKHLLRSHYLKKKKNINIKTGNKTKQIFTASSVQSKTTGLYTVGGQRSLLERHRRTRFLWKKS